MLVMQMNVDIVVERRIANYDQYLRQMIDLFGDENFLNVVVMQMDHEHLLMNHMKMNDVDHYLIPDLLLVMFYLRKKKKFMFCFYLYDLPHSF
jgi:hypothetical protein